MTGCLNSWNIEILKAFRFPAEIHSAIAGAVEADGERIPDRCVMVPQAKVVT